MFCDNHPHITELQSNWSINFCEMRFHNELLTDLRYSDDFVRCSAMYITSLMFLDSYKHGYQADFQKNFFRSSLKKFPCAVPECVRHKTTTIPTISKTEICKPIKQAPSISNFSINIVNFFFQLLEHGIYLKCAHITATSSVTFQFRASNSMRWNSIRKRLESKFKKWIMKLTKKKILQKTYSVDQG